MHRSGAAVPNRAGGPRGAKSNGAQTGLRALLRANGLSLVLLGGQAVSGMHEYNEEQSAHGESPFEISGAPERDLIQKLSP